MGICNCARVKSQLFNAIAEVAILRVGEFNEKALANIVWAFATAKVSHPLFFGEVAETLFSAIAEEALLAWESSSHWDFPTLHGLLQPSK